MRAAAPLRLVLFDVDGTLVDSAGRILAAMGAAFAAVGRPAPDRVAALETVGLSLTSALARLAPDLPETERARMIACYRAAFAACPRRSALYPGVAEALARLSAAPMLLLGLATGKSRAGLAAVLDETGIAGHFVTRQVADDHPSKPDPAMVLAALAETGVAPAEAVLVGDAVHDMAMARAAGIRALGVGWGFGAPAALRAAGAEAVVPRAEALSAALDRIWRTTA